jgi:ATP-dependent 26S proteasome regulatory subunit
MSYIQWRVRGDGYCPEGEVILEKSVPAGQYEITGFGPGLPNGVKPMSPVKDDLVRVPDTISDVVLKEIEQFQGLKAQYKAHGAVHKRGFLLYGPPGTGKTCTIWQIADESVAKFGAIVIHCQSIGHLTGVMQHIRGIEPVRPLVVMMEDVDSIANEQEERLLDMLDGKTAVDGVAFIATTNYLSRLPSRLRNRPSRFDRIVKVGAPTEAHRIAYLKSRHMELEPKQLKQWLKDTDGWSLAHVKELILSTQVLAVSYKEAIKRIGSMHKEALEEAKQEENN